MKKFFKENRKGFTLIELLVVIAILAVLATLYVPKIISGTDNAKKAVAISNARQLASEITAYNFTATAKIAANNSAYAFLSDTDLEDADDSADKTALKKYHQVSLNDLTGKIDMTGRDFPDDSYVRILVDQSGNAIIVNADFTNVSGDLSAE